VLSGLVVLDFGSSIGIDGNQAAFFELGELVRSGEATVTVDSDWGPFRLMVRTLPGSQPSGSLLRFNDGVETLTFQGTTSGLELVAENLIELSEVAPLPLAL
jgi:hypothetical protein